MIKMPPLPDAQSTIQVIFQPRTPGKSGAKGTFKLDVTRGAAVQDLVPMLHANLTGGASTGASWAPSSWFRWWKQGGLRSPELSDTTPSYHFFVAASSAPAQGADEVRPSADDLRAVPLNMSVGELADDTTEVPGSEADTRNQPLIVCLYYERETYFGDLEEDIMCLECCALLACCGLCCTAEARGASSKPQNPPQSYQLSNTQPTYTNQQNPEQIYYPDGPSNTGNNYYANNTYGVPPNPQYGVPVYGPPQGQYPYSGGYPPPANYPPPGNYPPPASFPAPANVYPPAANTTQPAYYSQPPAQYSNAPGNLKPF